LGVPRARSEASTRGLTLWSTHGGSKWAEADTRLTRITTAAFEPTIEKLGGKIILQQLRDAHKEYGEALGITAEGQDIATANIKEPLKDFTDALRAYVLAVAAHADPKDEASGELTDALLAPLYRWQSYVTVAASAAESTPETGTAPGQPGPTWTTTTTPATTS
jgi:hypothetical protein